MGWIFKSSIAALSERNRLVSNIFSLSVAQTINYLLPLITFPYLTRVLGAEKFGLLAFATAFIMYFQLLTDYGFNITAVRDISMQRDNKKKLQEIVATVMYTKAALMIIGLAIVTVLVIFIPRFHAEWKIYLLSYGMVVGSVIFPTWLFLGMEKTKYIAFNNIIARGLFTLFIFIAVKENSDYLYVPIINTLSALVASTASLLVASKRLDIGLRPPQFQELIKQLRKGWNVFSSTIAINTAIVSNTFILGLFASNTLVGFYSAGEKIVNIVIIIPSILTQAFFPKICYLYKRSEHEALRLVKKIEKILGLVGIILSLSIFMLAGTITRWMLGTHFEESTNVLRILAWTPLLSAIGTVYGTLFLLAFGYNKVLRDITLFWSGISIIGALLAVKLIKPAHIAISINMIVTQIILVAMVFFAYRRYRKQAN